MNIFKNKYFLLGNLAFLLLAIPVALYLISNQTTTTGSAEATTTLSFTPPSLSPNQCDATQTAKLMVNPGDNIISTIQLALKWDKTKFDIDFAPNDQAFTQILSGREDTDTGMTITLNIGADVTKAITTTTEVGTVTIKPISPTNNVPALLDIDATGTKVYSLSQRDGATENVYNPAGSSPLQINIAAAACGDGSTATPTPSPENQTNPTPTPTVASTTPSPTISANQPPVCLNLVSSVSSGSAPLAVNFTAGGNDSDGTIVKTTFNFGNGNQQDTTTGMGTASVSAQISYTYTSGGTFTATAVFTDNNGGISASCSQQIQVAGAVATPQPTITPTAVPISPTTPPTATPTIADSGTLTTTVGIIGGVIVLILAGVFLFVL